MAPVDTLADDEHPNVKQTRAGDRLRSRRSGETQTDRERERIASVPYTAALNASRMRQRAHLYESIGRVTAVLPERETERERERESERPEQLRRTETSR